MTKDDFQWEIRKLIGKLNHKWGSLFGNEAMKAQGRLDIFLSKIQSHYGITKKDATKMLDKFFEK